jgi:hypothetical protein
MTRTTGTTIGCTLLCVVIAAAMLSTGGAEATTTASPSLAAPLFFEDWESATSVPNTRWSILPMPPGVYGQGQILTCGNPGRCLRPLTMQSHWGSFFVANGFFPDVSSGLQLEMEFLLSGGPQHYHDAWFGLIDPGEGGARAVEFWANDGYGLWRVVLSVDGCVSESPGSIIIPDVWHSATLRIDQDGSVVAQLDGQIVASCPGSLDISPSRQLKLFVAGNSLYYLTCIDNVAVRSLAPPVTPPTPPIPGEEYVPDSGALLLLGSGLIGLATYATLRRRGPV